MYYTARRVFLNVLICLLLSFQVSQGFFIKPGYQHVVRNKRGHTTVCVEIKPSVTGSNEPYYMCKGPEFPVRPPNMPTPAEFVKNNGASYPFQNLPFENAYQPPPQVPRGESHPPLGVSQTLQFGHAYQQPAQAQPAPGVLETPEENQDHFQPYSGYSMSYPMPPPQMPTYRAADFMQHHQYHQAAAQPTITDFPKNVHTPAQETTSNSQNNYESHIQPPTTTAFSNAELKQHYDTSRSEALTEKLLQGKSAPNSEHHQANNKELPILDLKEDVKHKINAEQFNALIEDEVLGTPNLGFTHDEMLPIHNNLYAEENMRQPSVEANIPAEYLDDPILRTFYNINDNPAKHQVGSYFPQTAQLNQANMNNMDDCFEPYSLLQKPAYIPSAEPTAHMDSFKNHYNADSNSCCGCPFSFQPLFIAIPWLAGLNHSELFTQMHPAVYAQLPLHESYPSPASNSAQFRDNEDLNFSTEDLANKKQTIEGEMKNNVMQPPTSTKKSPDFFEEDLFVEDTTTKNGKLTKNDDEETLGDTKDDESEEVVQTTTTSAPFTTVRTFKTLMHAAKMASRLNKNPEPGDVVPTLQNKRQVHYLTGPVYPTNFKRQYVRKLEQMYN